MKDGGREHTERSLAEWRAFDAAVHAFHERKESIVRDRLKTELFEASLADYLRVNGYVVSDPRVSGSGKRQAGPG
jgi:uncharacterized protein YdaU (DUF1376 family)